MKNWQGPGKVIAQDGSQVLVKSGVTGSNDSPPFHDSPGKMTEMTRLK